jgi:hypothetical protein
MKWAYFVVDAVGTLGFAWYLAYHPDSWNVWLAVIVALAIEAGTIQKL